METCRRKAHGRNGASAVPEMVSWDLKCAEAGEE